MYLKRLYDTEAPKEKFSIRTDVCSGCDRGKVVNAARDGVEDCPICGGDGKMKVAVPPVRGITVLRARSVQRFTQNLINGGLREGWLGMSGGRIHITAESGNLTYLIIRTPGAYCCHCDESVPGGGSPASAEESLTHVAQAHPEETCPDPQNPAGYRVENFYTGILEEGEPIETAAAKVMDKQVRQALIDRTQPYAAGGAKAGPRKEG